MMTAASATGKSEMMMTSSPARIPVALSLAHWMRPGNVVRLDASLLDGAPTRLAEAVARDPEMDDEMVAYDGVMATEDPWMLRLWSYDEKERMYAPRWTELRLRINPRTVTAKLKTAAGIPAMWNHLTFASGALGRVIDMRAEGGKLKGGLMLSSLALAGWGTSLVQLDAGMNRGLSVGVHLYDKPKRKLAEGDNAGTFDFPDSLTYGRIRVTEVSLTATPMIAQAGIIGRRKEPD